MSQPPVPGRSLVSAAEPVPVHFETLYQQLYPSLFRYLHRLVGDADAADDIAQEAFVRLLERRGPEGEGARLWLFTVATNLVRDRGRAVTRRQRLLQAAPVAPASLPLPDEDAERAERIARVRAVLEQLPERDRQLLLMREEGFRYGEIAEAVGVAPGSVGTLIARALRKFAEVYGTSDDDDVSHS